MNQVTNENTDDNNMQEKGFGKNLTHNNKITKIGILINTFLVKSEKFKVTRYFDFAIYIYIQEVNTSATSITMLEPTEYNISVKNKFKRILKNAPHEDTNSNTLSDFIGMRNCIANT